MWEILKAEGIDPAPGQAATTWAAFLRSRGGGAAGDGLPKIGTATLIGQRRYVLAVIEHATRRVRILGAIARPAHARVTQAIKSMVMDLQDAGCHARFLVRDRDAKHPALIDTILAGAGISTVLNGVRIPRMNSIMEWWVQTCRRELLDRTLIWNERHLRYALREFAEHYNRHRPHQAMGQAAPLRPVPEPITESG